MNIQTGPRMDKAHFTVWAEAKEERYELAGGLAVMMPRPSLAHGLIVSNTMFALRRQVAEFGLDTGPGTLRYPDIVVDRTGGSAKSYTARAPVLLEVDLGDKPAEYLQLPSVLIYVVLSQDEPKAYV
jgi:Putative restriction endonuclease